MYVEKCKLLLKGSNEDLNKWRVMKCFMNQKTQYFLNTMYKI